MTRQELQRARILSANGIIDEILRAVSNRPMTIKEILEKVACNEEQANRAVKLLAKIGLLRFENGKARLEPTVEDLLEEIC